MPSKKTDLFHEEPFQSFFEQIPTPLCCYDKQSKIIRCNPQFEQLLGCPRNKIEGQNFFEVLVPNQATSRLKKILDAVFSKRGTAHISLKSSPTPGELRYFSLTTFPVFDRSKKIAFGGALVIDITEKKSLEQALIHAEKMAAMGTLATGLAHEVGTPMNIILGRAESLARYAREEKTVQGLNIIIEQIDRMTHLIERLLAFARRKPIVREPLQVNTVIQKGVEIIEQRATEKRVSLVTILDPTLPLIWGDAEQLLQVIVNLLMNAVDAMPNGGEIHIESRITPTTIKNGQRGKLEIIIRDTGVGIEAADRNKIFDPFFTTKPVGKGTGLGLAVAHGIIREHDGEIEVKSRTGKGTTFYISLPDKSLRRGQS